eukprot:6235620-Ditylum_brightwellii.AAC.1
MSWEFSLRQTGQRKKPGANRSCGQVVSRRNDEEGIHRVLPLLAAFCLKKEDMTTQTYCAASNMVATRKGVVMDHLYKLLRGFMVEDKIGTAKFTLIRTVIHNKL